MVSIFRNDETVIFFDVIGVWHFSEMDVMAGPDLNDDNGEGPKMFICTLCADRVSFVWDVLDADIGVRDQDGKQRI